MTKKADQRRRLVVLGGTTIVGWLASRYFGLWEIDISKDLPTKTQTGSVVASGSIPGQYPEGYTGDCTGCEVVSGDVLDSYYDIFVETIVEPLEESRTP